MTGFQTAPQGASVMVNIFGGDRRLVPSGTRALLTVRDGNQDVVHRDFHTEPSILLRGLHVFHNFGDSYTVIASSPGTIDAGYFPVPMAENVVQSVDLMLLPKSSGYNFAGSTWKALATTAPRLRTLLTAGTQSPEAAEQRYTTLIETGSEQPKAACILNLMAAMKDIHLPQGTPLDYIQQVIWDKNQQDRIFVWANATLIDQVKTAALHGQFSTAPAMLHPGATKSWKQNQFGEANVQLTFHEEDCLEVGGVNCVMLEPDIDYYRDPGAHLLIEVVPNALGGALTDPKMVYLLRWIAGRHAGVPEFDPLYTIEPA